MVKIKVNCKYNDCGKWCSNKNIKRSFFVVGSRHCLDFINLKCDLKEKNKFNGYPQPAPQIKQLKQQ